MLTTDDLTAIRADIVALLPDSCEIKRLTTDSDGMGGQTESWDTQATVSCRIAPAGGGPQERTIANKLSSVSAWTITLPAETDVKTTDRLVVGSRAFEVVAVLARSGEVARRVVCTEAV